MTNNNVTTEDTQVKNGATNGQAGQVNPGEPKPRPSRLADRVDLDDAHRLLKEALDAIKVIEVEAHGLGELEPDNQEIKAGLYELLKELRTVGTSVALANEIVRLELVSPKGDKPQAPSVVLDAIDCQDIRDHLKHLDTALIDLMCVDLEADDYTPIRQIAGVAVGLRCSLQQLEGEAGQR